MKFNRLTVLDSFKLNKRKMCKCLCDCGTVKNVREYDLRKELIKSCGCLSKELAVARNKTHNQSKTRTYRIWAQMKQRCCNSLSTKYRNYGGRGITVCDSWLNSFESFYKDMGECIGKNEIDRTDNNGNYEPNNCKWVSHKENLRNTRVCKPFMFNGEVKTIAEWSELTGIKYGRLLDRIKRGMNLEKAMLNINYQGGRNSNGRFS